MVYTKRRNFSLLFIVLTLFQQGQVLQTDTFFYSGNTQTFVVPNCISNLTIQLEGGAGGVDPVYPSLGHQGEGGRIRVVITPTPGAVLYLNVGGRGGAVLGGWNGGGNGGAGSRSSGAGGGGASDIRIGGNTLSDRVFVAGGGGGTGGGSGPYFGAINANTSECHGGNGGGLNCWGLNNLPNVSCPPIYGCGGQSSNAQAWATCQGVIPNNAFAGGGGLSSGGGAGTSTTGCSGSAGTLHYGGNGGDSTCNNSPLWTPRYGGGGGGGGYYGGGGGHSSAIHNPNNTKFDGNSGGGGGSTYLHNAYVVTYTLFGYNTYNMDGLITLSYFNYGTIASASQNSICAGETVSLSASGVSNYTWLPVGNFTGAINQSIQVIPNGNTNYTVVGQNQSGCVSQVVVPIHVLTQPSLSILPMFPAVCINETVNISAQGAGSYSWSNGQVSNNIFVSPSVTTVYTLTANPINTLCSSSKTFQVLVYENPQLNVSATKTTACVHEPITVTAGGALTYTWFSAGGTTTVNSGSMLVSPLHSITYSVIGANASKCKSETSLSITVSECTGLIENEIDFIKIYPNPAKHQFAIYCPYNSRVVVYSALGNVVYSDEIKAGVEKTIQIATPGIYIIQYHSHKREQYSKIVITD